MMDIAAGAVMVENDHTRVINAPVAAGKITAYGGTGTIKAAYNSIYPGMTPVTAVPEPATWALRSFGLLWLRAAGRARHVPA